MDCVPWLFSTFTTAGILQAQVRLQEALQVDENNHNVFAAARNHFLLAVVAEGMGDSRTRLQQLDAAVANLKRHGPKVEWGSIVGQEYVRAGALAKAAILLEFITPLADAHDNEQQGYVHLLHGAIAAEKGETDKAVAELSPLTDPTFGAVREQSGSGDNCARLPTGGQSGSIHRLV